MHSEVLKSCSLCSCQALKQWQLDIKLMTEKSLLLVLNARSLPESIKQRWWQQTLASVSAILVASLPHVLALLSHPKHH